MESFETTFFSFRLMIVHLVCIFMLSWLLLCMGGSYKWWIQQAYTWCSTSKGGLCRWSQFLVLFDVLELFLSFKITPKLLKLIEGFKFYNWKIRWKILIDFFIVFWKLSIVVFRRSLVRKLTINSNKLHRLALR